MRIDRGWWGRRLVVGEGDLARALGGGVGGGAGVVLVVGGLVHIE